MIGKIEKFKKSKPFELFDIVIYSLLITITVLLFSFFTRNQNAIGFNIKIENRIIVSYYFEKNEIKINDDYSDFIEYDKLNNLITIYVNDDKTQFNTICFDTINKTVWVSDSNCSERKDCVHTKQLTDKGIIYCMPHKLSVSLITNQYKTNPVTGKI